MTRVQENERPSRDIANTSSTFMPKKKKIVNGFRIQNNAFRLFIKLRDNWHQNGWLKKIMGALLRRGTFSRSLSPICQGLQRMDKHSSLPDPTQALVPFSPLPALTTVATSWILWSLWMAPSCKLSDLYSYSLSIRHSYRADKSL